MLRIIFVYRNTLSITIDTNSQLTVEMLFHVRINYKVQQVIRRIVFRSVKSPRHGVLCLHNTCTYTNERKQRVCVTTCSRHINKRSRAIIIYARYLQSTIRRCIGRQINQKFRVCRKFTFYLFLYLIKSQLRITAYIIN